MTLAQIAMTVGIAAAMLVAVTGLAVLIASIAKTERGAGGFGSLIVQFMALIGGVFFPITILGAYYMWRDRVTWDQFAEAQRERAAEAA